MTFGGGLRPEEQETIEARLLQIQRARLDLLAQISTQPTDRVSVFISYSHRDEAFRRELGNHLAILERQGLIEAWYDRKITAGAEWKGSISQRLDSARVVLLLISADFVNSDYCYDIEMTRALQRHDNREALVVPVILRPVLLEGSPFAKLQALPRDAQAVTSWSDRDAAFVDITEGLRDAIREFVPVGA